MSLGHRKSVECLAFSSNSELLCSGSWDRTAIVWDVEVYIFNHFLYTSNTRDIHTFVARVIGNVWKYGNRKVHTLIYLKKLNLQIRN